MLIILKETLKNHLKVLVTNQSGIGRGYFKYKDFKLFTTKLIHILNKLGLNISKVYFCPHHPKAKLKNLNQIVNLENLRLV